MKYAWVETKQTVVIQVPVLDPETGLPVEPEEFTPTPTLRGTGNGYVTGLNRAGQEGEETGNCTNTQLTKGMDATWYKVVNDYFTEKTEEEKATEDELISRDKALPDMLLQIDNQCSEEDLKHFQYDEHNYYADKDTITSVAVECATMEPLAPIPTPNGVWKSADTEEDGLTPVYVPFTCGEYIPFKSALYNRGSFNFGVKEFHKNNVKNMYLAGATSAELEAYDYSEGWA